MTDTILEWLRDIIDSLYQSFIYEFYLKITIIISAIANFVLDIFDDCGSKVVGFGDLLANAFSRNGFNGFNNFFYGFIGIIFVVFCIKTGIKLILKLIDIVGNYIPFT